MAAKKESKAKRLARQEVDRLEGVVSRRGAKHAQAKTSLKAAKERLKKAK